jgi:hypothetical protein
MQELLIFPSKEETKEILNSRTARKFKGSTNYFESIRVVKNMRLRLVVFQQTIDGMDTVELLITPSENKPSVVFDIS